MKNEIKAKAVLKKSRHLWVSIEGEVQDWVDTNWSRWQEEKPKWLNEAVMARIPVEYIPTFEAREEEKGRRTSVVAVNLGEGSKVVRGQEQSTEKARSRAWRKLIKEAK